MANDVINEIEIVSVETVSVSDGKCAVNLVWVLDGGLGQYSGEYMIRLFEGGACVSEQKPRCDKAQCEVVFEGISADKEYQVSVGLPDEAGGVESDRETLILLEFRNVAAVYDGSSISVTWDTAPEITARGVCDITSDKGFNHAVKFTAEAGKLRMDSMYFKEGQLLTVCLAVWEGISKGPVSEALTLYTAPARIVSAALKPVKDGTEVAVEFQSAHTQIKEAALSFSLDGAELFLSEPVSPTFQNTYAMTVMIPSSQIPYELLCRCCVSCVCGGKNAKTYIADPASSIPLAQPEVSVEGVSEGKVCMKISFPEDTGAVGFELPDGTVVYDRGFSVSMGEDASYTVRPRFDCGGIARKGVGSPPVSNFVSGYYVAPDADGNVRLVYRQGSYLGTSVKKVWDRELFKTRPEEELQSGVLKLTPSDQAYTLTVDTTRVLSCADYDSFIEKIKDTITPFGFFELTDAITRMAVYDADSAPYLICAYRPEDRTVDIRPKTCLSVQTSMYIQGTGTAKNSDGFVLNGVNRWNVSFRPDDGFLEFDPFVGKIAAHMSAHPANASTQVINACSVTDFMSPAMRQPYYRIMFPSGLPAPGDPETPYPSKNIGIMAADSYGEILSSCERIRENPSQINQLGIPFMIFRGKSVLSLEIPVYVNGQLTYVPVGSDVGYVMQICGFGDCGRLCLERENCDGKLCCVYFDRSAKMDRVVLLAGDRIGV